MSSGGATLCLALAHFAVVSLILANYVSGKVERVANLTVDLGANLNVVTNSNSHRYLTMLTDLESL